MTENCVTLKNVVKGPRKSFTFLRILHFVAISKDYSGLWSNTSCFTKTQSSGRAVFQFLASLPVITDRVCMEAIFHEKVHFAVDFFLPVNLQMFNLIHND